MRQGSMNRQRRIPFGRTLAALSLIIAGCGPSAKFSANGTQTTQPPPTGAPPSKQGDATAAVPPAPPAPTSPATHPGTTEQKFAAGGTNQGTIDFDLHGLFLADTITLLRNDTAGTQTWTQPAATAVTEHFSQGTAGAVRTETFQQTQDRPLDIVAITDNSVSMGDQDANGVSKQQKVAGRVMDLLSEIQDTDWQLAVVTTDPSDGALRKLIKKGDANPVTAFQQAWLAGTTGSDNERGILQAVRSLSGYQLPASWLRPNSTVAVLIVSDEDNCSAASMATGNGPNQDNCPGKSYANGQYLVDYLASIRQVGATARVYGIIWGPDQTQAQCPLGFNQGIEYAKAITATGGSWGSICDLDYAPTLRRISQDIKATLTTSFTQAFQPVAGSVQVQINGVPLPAAGATVAGNVVQLASPPPAGATVSITYRHDPVAIRQSFTLGKPAKKDGLVVTVNGVQAALGSDFNLNASGTAIDFVAPPPDNADIAVTYLQQVDLPHSFVLATPPLPGSVEVTVDGKKADGVAFDQTNATLSFPTPPGEKAKIEVAYKVQGTPTLDYASAVAASANDAKDVEAYDAATLAPVAVTIVNGKVHIQDHDFSLGRRITVRSHASGQDPWTLKLPNSPLPASVKITSGQKTCTPSDGIEVTGQSALIKNCGFPADAAQFHADYSYASPPHQDFAFTAATPKNGADQKWQVLINDVETKDFSVQGTQIHLQSAPAADAVITVRLTQISD